MRSLFGYLLRRSWLALLISILGGIISGLSGVCLLAVINYTLDHSGDNLFWPVFIPLCLTFVVGRFLSEYILSVLGQNSIRELRVELSKRVIGLPLSKVQTLGAANILANLTHDII
jgi:putative ATP-binding cassette transporter